MCKKNRQLYIILEFMRKHFKKSNDVGFFCSLNVTRRYFLKIWILYLIVLVFFPNKTFIIILILQIMKAILFL